MCEGQKETDMRHIVNQKRSGHLVHLPRRLQWIAWPIIMLGGCGGITSRWLAEGVELSDCVPALTLPIFASVLFFFNNYIFNKTSPHRNDVHTLSTKYTTLSEEKNRK